MAHREWCGKPCSECKNPCRLDESIPCSPDCENLLPDGDPDPEKCKGCDAYEEYKIMMGIEDEEEMSDGERGAVIIDKLLKTIGEIMMTEQKRDEIRKMLYELYGCLDV